MLRNTFAVKAGRREEWNGAGLYQVIVVMISGAPEGGGGWGGDPPNFPTY
jgi:hypothetical protein